MNKIDRLFDLVSNLNSSEKGYVSKRLKLSKSKSNLFELYSCISKLEVYDESALKKKIRTPSLIKNLSVTKRQLFETILRIVRNYGTAKNEYRRVFNILEDIEFLFEKKMTEECERMIEKGLRICNDLEMYGIKIHFLDWKRRILNSNYYKGDLEEIILALKAEADESVRKIDSIQNLEHEQLLLHHTIFHKKWSNKNNVLGQYLDELGADIKMLNEKGFDLGNREMISITDISARLTFHKGDLDNAFVLLKKETERIRGKVNPLVVENLQRILLVQLGMSVKGGEEEWKKVLEKIEKLQKEYPLLKQINFAEMFVLTYRLQYDYIHGLLFDKERVNMLEDFLEEEGNSIPMSAWMSFHVSRYYFSYGKFQKAHLWNIRALNGPQSQIKNFTYICRFYMLMILLELEYYDLIKKSIEDLRRYLIRKDHLSNFEKALIEFFKRAGSKWNKNTHKSLLMEFEELMNPYMESLTDTFFYLDIPNWLLSKKKNLTLASFKNGFS